MAGRPKTRKPRPPAPPPKILADIEPPLVEKVSPIRDGPTGPVGGGKTTLRVRILMWQDEVPRIDVRRYVETGRYSGATQKGYSYTREEFAALLAHGQEILAQFDAVADAAALTLHQRVAIALQEHPSEHLAPYDLITVVPTGGGIDCIRTANRDGQHSVLWGDALEVWSGDVYVRDEFMEESIDTVISTKNPDPAAIANGIVTALRAWVRKGGR